MTVGLGHVLAPGHDASECVPCLQSRIAELETALDNLLADAHGNLREPGWTIDAEVAVAKRQRRIDARVLSSQEKQSLQRERNATS